MAAPLHNDVRFAGSRLQGKELGFHKGLWFERFFNKYNRDWNLEGQEQAKSDWIQSVTNGVAGDSKHLQQFAASQQQLVERLSGASQVFETEWNFVTGMGNAHPVENGFSWHPTLGTPYLSGASVKGLVRAWVEKWSGLENTELKAACLKWFGSEPKNSKEQGEDNRAGSIIFFDAVPYEPVSLSCDIMTPHMKDWYAKGGSISDVSCDSSAIPADWHDPGLVPFLVVKKAKFLFSVAARTGNAKEDIKQLLEVLGYALEYLGAGAKTAACYGRMTPDQKANKQIEKVQKEAKLAELPEADRYREMFTEMDEKLLAQTFGRDINKTIQSAGDSWEVMLDALFEVRGEEILSWSDAPKKSAQESAYKKLKSKTGRIS